MACTNSQQGDLIRRSLDNLIICLPSLHTEGGEGGGPELKGERGAGERE